MKCLVTGGAGFFGSHIIQHFLDCGHEVAPRTGDVKYSVADITEIKKIGLNRDLI
jgi:nucleoside-diphosphate-sugar epimerase